MCTHYLCSHNTWFCFLAALRDILPLQPVPAPPATMPSASRWHLFLSRSPPRLPMPCCLPVAPTCTTVTVPHVRSFLPTPACHHTTTMRFVSCGFFYMCLLPHIYTTTLFAHALHSPLPAWFYLSLVLPGILPFAFVQFALRPSLPFTTPLCLYHQLVLPRLFNYFTAHAAVHYHTYHILRSLCLPRDYGWCHSPWFLSATTHYTRIPLPYFIA